MRAINRSLFAVFVAIAPCVLTLGVREELGRYIGDGPIFSFFLMAIVLSGWMGGWVTAALSTLLTAAGAGILGPAAFGEQGLTVLQSYVRLGFFVLSGFTVSGLYALIHRESRRSHNANERARRNEERLHSLTELMPQLIWEANGEGKMVYINNRLREAAGLTGDARVCDWLDNLHPEEAQLLRAEFANCVQTGRTFERECRFRFPDGKYRWHIARAEPRRNQIGQIERWFGTCTDIENQKRMETALREGESLFRQLAENIRDQVFYLTDLEKNEIRYVSPAYEKIWGRSVESLYRDRFSFLKSIHPEDVQRMRESVGKVAAGASMSIEYRVVRPDGTTRWILDRAFPVEGERGKVFRLAGIAEDITESKMIRAEKERIACELLEAKDAAEKAKLEAEAANDAKSRFLANVSHEIRTPLGAILGFAELMRESSQCESERFESIATILRNGEQLSSVVNDILDLSKIECERLEIERLPVNPLVLLEDVTRLLSLQAKAKGLALTVSSESALPELICTDPTRLRQILINVLGNAIKFTARGRIDMRVKSEPMGESVVLRFSIRDTGPGIPRASWDRLFQPFSQADISTTRVYGGSGLGLALSRKLAQALGGDLVLLESELDRGSKFELTIRAETRTAGACARESNAQSRAMLAKGDENFDMSVLLVDDVADNRLLVSRYLKDAVANIDCAENGIEAVNAALLKNYDVVLMDLQMPCMDGYQALKELRERGYSGPIVALTAHAMRGYREKCLSAGFTDYLVKPFKKNDLLETLGHFRRQGSEADQLLHH